MFPLICLPGVQWVSGTSVCWVLQILTPIVILVTIVSAVSCSLFTNNNTQHVTLIIITLSSSLTTVDTGHWTLDTLQYSPAQNFREHLTIRKCILARQLNNSSFTLCVIHWILSVKFCLHIPKFPQTHRLSLHNTANVQVMLNSICSPILILFMFCVPFMF